MRSGPAGGELSQTGRDGNEAPERRQQAGGGADGAEDEAGGRTEVKESGGGGRVVDAAPLGGV